SENPFDEPSCCKLQTLILGAIKVRLIHRFFLCIPGDEEKRSLFFVWAVLMLVRKEELRILKGKSFHMWIEKRIRAPSSISVLRV
ncbi:hypothetical protein LINPERPRIM_LOCUS33114, partial [Linum perenne]